MKPGMERCVWYLLFFTLAVWMHVSSCFEDDSRCFHVVHLKIVYEKLTMPYSFDFLLKRLEYLWNHHQRRMVQEVMHEMFCQKQFFPQSFSNMFKSVMCNEKQKLSGTHRNMRFVTEKMMKDWLSIPRPVICTSTKFSGHNFYHKTLRCWHSFLSDFGAHVPIVYIHYKGFKTNLDEKVFTTRALKSSVRSF